MPAEQTIISGPGGPLAVWEWPGGEPPALLLHGIGNYGRVWDFVADAVHGRLRLIAPDARAHGDSATPETGYAPEDFVADAIAVMNDLDLDRPVVVGHSMGGAHALILAALHPERVRALVLVDVGPEIGREGGDRARRLSVGRPDRFADDDAALAYLRETSPGYSDAVYANRIAHAFARDAGGLAWRSRKDALLKILSGPDRRADAWRALASLTMPVLVVRGTRSETLRAETYARMLETIPNATGLELDAGHNVQLDRPRELADAIVALARGRGDIGSRRMSGAAWSEGARSGALLGICAVFLAIFGLSSSFSWVPEALLLGVATIVPIVILARAGSRAAAKANNWAAGALAGAVSGSIGGLVGGAAYVFFGKPALNLLVGLALGSIGGALVGAMAATTTRGGRRSRPAR